MSSIKISRWSKCKSIVLLIQLHTLSTLPLFLWTFLFIQFHSLDRADGAPPPPHDNGTDHDETSEENNHESTTEAPQIEVRLIEETQAEQWLKTKHAYIRVCGSRGSFGVEARKCQYGVVLKKPFIPGCVCIRGVWVVHTKFCLNTPMVLLGGSGKHDQDCYTIDFEVTSFLFLGDVETPFLPKAYVAPQAMTVFYEIPQNGTWTPVLDFEDPVVVAINPRGSSYESEETQDCFTERESDPSPPEMDKVAIWATALLSTRYRKVKKCQNPLFGGFQSVATHDAFYYHGSTQFAVPSEGCSNPCPIWTNFDEMYHEDTYDGKPRYVFEDWVDILKLSPEEKESKRKKGIRRTKLNRLLFEREEASARGGTSTFLSRILKSKPATSTEKVTEKLEESTLKPNTSAGSGSKGVMKRRKSVTPVLSSEMRRESKEEVANGRGHGNESGGEKVRVRKKRRIVQCDEVWNGRASCLLSYWDPLDKFEISEKDQKICFPSLDVTPRPPPPKFG